MQQYATEYMYVDLLNTSLGLDITPLRGVMVGWLWAKLSTIFMVIHWFFQKWQQNQPPLLHLHQLIENFVSTMSEGIFLRCALKKFNFQVK